MDWIKTWKLIGKDKTYLVLAANLSHEKRDCLKGRILPWNWLGLRALTIVNNKPIGL